MSSPPTSRVLTLVFTDLANSTALKTQHGDAVVGELIARHREHVVRLAAECGGRIIDWAGDGCFLTFDTSSAGVLFGLRLQETHHWESALPRVRIGIHMGEVSESSFNGSVRVEGLIVDLAARIAGLATPGQTLLSGAVQQSARQRLDAGTTGKPVRWEAHGNYTFKGFDEPVDVREAGFDGVSPFAPPDSSDKAWPVRDGSGPDRSKPIRKIAVLPFTGFSDSQEQDWFVDGMTETLIAELAKIRALVVISRTSVMHYKNSQKPLREIAAELGVDAFVEGSVMRAGNRLRITAQLIDANSDAHLWADRYDGTLEEVLDLQANVALAVARQVNVTLSADEAKPLRQSRPVHPHAFEMLMRAKHRLHDDRRAEFNEAIGLAERAIEADPDYADAYAWLAAIYSQHIIYGTVEKDRAYARGRIAALDALRLDDTSAVAYAVLGQLARAVEWDWNTGLHYALRAAEIDPSDSNIQCICAFAHAYKAEYEQARRRVQRAIETDPHNPLTYIAKGSVLLAERRYDETIQLGREKIADFPQHAALRGFYCIALMLDGALTRAIEQAETQLSLSNRAPQYVSFAGAMYALAGDPARAEACLAELRAHPLAHLVRACDTGIVLAALGRMDEAYPDLERSVRARDFSLAWLCLVNALDLFPARREERFERIVGRIGIVRPAKGAR